MIRKSIIRKLVLFFLLPCAVVGFICFAARQQQTTQASYESEKWQHEHQLTEWEKVEAQEKMKNVAQAFTLEHPTTPAGTN